MPARPKRLLKKTQGMSAADLEFLIEGANLFTGDKPHFQNEEEIEKAYKRYKPMLLLLRDKSEYPDSAPYFSSGQRFWAFYKYEFENGEELFRKFQKAVLFSHNYEFEFNFLKKSGLLEPGEESKYHELMAERLKHRIKLQDFKKNDD